MVCLVASAFEVVLVVPPLFPSLYPRVTFTFSASSPVIHFLLIVSNTFPLGVTHVLLLF
jgi:hypothetical protein